jgi:hypothetical protein
MVIGLAGAIALGGCSSMVSSATARLSDSLTAAVLDQNDPETVRQGAPAYLLLIDGLIADDPQNVSLLLAGAKLYSSYAAAFVDDEERSVRLAERARDYGFRGLCRSSPSACDAWNRPYDEFEPVIASLGPRDVPALFVSAAAWASWIQVNRDDWSAVADKARVELMMLRVVTLDESFQRGAAHLYLGVLATLLPEAMGGKPEDGRRFFERAIELSNGRDLMAKVLLAREYAKLVFDRELHDRLCREVLESDPVEPGLTLTNTLAIEEAQRLLADSEEYFGE